jgi:hypothetical protein
VIGLTASKAARNVLASVGVDHAENTASFLGHLPCQRGARHPRKSSRRRTAAARLGASRPAARFNGLASMPDGMRLMFRMMAAR